MDKAQKIIDALCGRSGFDAFWDACDQEIKTEILKEIADAIYSNSPLAVKEEGKPTGNATIVGEDPLEQFPSHDENLAG